MKTNKLTENLAAYILFICFFALPGNCSSILSQQYQIVQMGVHVVEEVLNGNQKSETLRDITKHLISSKHANTSKFLMQVNTKILPKNIIFGIYSNDQQYNIDYIDNFVSAVQNFYDFKTPINAINKVIKECSCTKEKVLRIIENIDNYMKTQNPLPDTGASSAAAAAAAPRDRLFHCLRTLATKRNVPTEAEAAAVGEGEGRGAEVANSGEAASEETGGNSEEGRNDQSLSNLLSMLKTIPDNTGTEVLSGTGAVASKISPIAISFLMNQGNILDIIMETMGINPSLYSGADTDFKYIQLLKSLNDNKATLRNKLLELQKKITGFPNFGIIKDLLKSSRLQGVVEVALGSKDSFELLKTVQNVIYEQDQLFQSIRQSQEINNVIDIFLAPCVERAMRVFVEDAKKTEFIGRVVLETFKFDGTDAPHATFVLKTTYSGEEFKRFIFNSLENVPQQSGQIQATLDRISALEPPKEQVTIIVPIKYNLQQLQPPIAVPTPVRLSIVGLINSVFSKLCSSRTSYPWALLPAGHSNSIQIADKHYRIERYYIASFYPAK